MSENDHIDAQWLRAAQSPPPPPRRRGFGCALSLLVLILVLAGVLFYPRVQALLTPVPTVQIQMESSVLPDTAPNCAANPRVAAVLHAAMRGQTDAVVYDCDAGTLEACMAELLDDPELWVRSYRYTVHGGLNAHITVTFDWVYPDDGPARHAELARTADGLLAAAPAEDYPRALYLYDWLLTHVRYVPRETYDQTAYAAVCEGEAVCGGIADAYVYLLERGGIPARVVTGTSLSADGTADSHAWVAAELDGAVYYFDPTWDLQDDESEAALPDYLSHTWFALTAERMADVLAETPAKLYGLFPRKGVLQPGADADIVVYDPRGTSCITAADQAANVDYAPYEGTQIAGHIAEVYLRGTCVVREGKILHDRNGQYLHRGKCML